MIAGCKDWVDPHRSVEIPLGTSEVSQIIFGNSSEEIGPVIGSVQLSEDIEVFDCLRVLALRQRMPSTHEEYILIILGIKLSCACQ